MFFLKYVFRSILLTFHVATPLIIYMSVSIWPIWIAGSWSYLAGSWKEATFYFIIILINIRENEILMYKLCIFEATLKLQHGETRLDRIKTWFQRTNRMTTVHIRPPCQKAISSIPQDWPSKRGTAVHSIEIHNNNAGHTFCDFIHVKVSFIQSTQTTIHL